MLRWIGAKWSADGGDDAAAAQVVDDDATAAPPRVWQYSGFAPLPPPNKSQSNKP